MRRTFVALVPFLFACGGEDASPAIEAVLRTSTGMEVGQAGLTELPAGVDAWVVAQSLTPGRHGVHLHDSGACEEPAFESAGPHLNPAGRQHGRQNPAGPHLGDLGNLEANSDGRGSLTVRLDSTLAPQIAPLLEGDGITLIVHADPDDESTDPAGNSGARIACAVLRR
jgi:Cu-Zn family superoxide dismutase